MSIQAEGRIKHFAFGGKANLKIGFAWTDKVAASTSSKVCVVYPNWFLCIWLLMVIRLHSLTYCMCDHALKQLMTILTSQGTNHIGVDGANEEPLLIRLFIFLPRVKWEVWCHSVFWECYQSSVAVMFKGCIFPHKIHFMTNQHCVSGSRIRSGFFGITALKKSPQKW